MAEESTVQPNAETATGGTRFYIGDIGPTRRTRRNRGGDTSGEAPSGEPNEDQPREPIPLNVGSQRTKRQTAASMNTAAADMICGLVETLGVMRYGPPARMQPNERTMITRGLQGSMASLPSSVTKQIAQLSAPLMAAMGLLFYAQRLAVFEVQRKANLAETIRSQQAEAVFQAERIVTTPPPSTTADFNGQSVGIPPSKDTLQDMMG